MIAVSIGRGRHRMMIAEHRHIAEQGAQLVELRLDYIVRAVNLKRLIAEKPTPVIITCRREQDGGYWKHTEQERMMLIRSAIAEGVEYIDLEMDIAAIRSRDLEKPNASSATTISRKHRRTCMRFTSNVRH